MNINNSLNVPFVDPQQLMNGVTMEQIRSTAKESVQKALELLGSALAGSIVDNPKAPGLTPPKSSLMQKVTDMTLKIALLQQALDELQQQVSKTTIEGRMKEVDQAHKEKLENIEEQMKEIKEAVDKQQEAIKKAGIFGFIVHFFMAIFDFLSAIFSMMAAAANLLVGNVAGAAGLVAAAGAQICSGFCNLTLAADSAMTAITGKGFLSEEAKKAVNSIMTSCAVVAAVGGLMGGLGAITVGLKEAMKAATGALLKEGVKMGSTQMAKASWIIAKQCAGAMLQNSLNPMMKEIGAKGIQEVTKATMKELAKAGIKNLGDDVLEEVVKATYKAFEEVYKATAIYALRMAATQALGKGATQIFNGAASLEIAKIREQAAEAMYEAEMAEAAAKAFEAMITMIKKSIEELQAQLEEMLNAAMESMSILFQALDDSAETMKQLHQSQMA